MAEGGAGTAARPGEGQCQNGGDPGRPRPRGFRRPSLLRRLADQVQNRLAADLDDRDPDFIREYLPLAWLASSLWFRGEVHNIKRAVEEQATVARR
jgi:hypothetical protein